MQPTPDDLLSIVDLMQELRQRYGRAPAYNTLWHALARGEIPAERVGRSWRVSRGDVPRVATAVGLAATA